LAGHADGCSGGSSAESSTGAASRRGRAIRHSAAPVPTMSATINSGVLKPTPWASAGRKLVTTAAPRTTTTQAPARTRTSRSPTGRSATIGLRRDPDRGDEDAAGERRAHLRAQPGLGPVERDREVGPDRRIGRLAAREVHGRRRVDGEDRDHRGAGPVDDLDGAPDRLAERAPDAGPEQRVDDDRRLVDALAEDRDVAGHRGVDQLDAWLALDTLPVPGQVGAP